MISWTMASSILILTIILLRRMCKGKISLRWQYAVWLLVAVRLLVPVQPGANSFGIENLMIGLSGQLQEKSGIQISEQWTSDEDYAGFYDEVLETYTNQKNNLSANLEKIGKIVWGIGAVLFGMTFIVINSLFGARIRRSREKIDVKYSSLPVYLSEEVDTPCLSGVRNTSIYVTKFVADSPVLLKHAVYHEMTHYRHGDQLWALVRCVCLALHWYNPFVWWAASLSKKDAEFACDEATILKLGEEERTEYGKTLIRLTCEKRQDILLTTTTMTSGKKNLGERIQFIAEKPKIRKRTFVLSLVAVIIIGFCTFTETKAKPRGSVEMSIGQELEEIDWEKVKGKIGEEEREVLEKYQVVLEGGQVVWTDRRVPSGEAVSRGSISGTFSIQAYIDTKMKHMDLEVDDVRVESFLFSDVFQSGELNVCLLVRHVSKSWIILHEEEGVIYGIEVSALNFKGVQEDGLYFAAGGAGIQYYERMNFKEGDCRFAQVGIALNGSIYYWNREKMSDEVAIYTLIEEK